MCRAEPRPAATKAVAKSPDLLAIGMRVRAARQLVGLSQEELAHHSGLHRNYIGGIERGERNVGILALVEIARALQVSPAAFFED